MWKLQSLRQLMERTVPELLREPERLIVMAADGHALATLAPGLSFEYRYTAAITVLDYGGHTDALFVPLLAWLRVHQSDVLDNPQSQREGLQFLVEYLNSATADIGIRVPLTERAIVKADATHPTRYTVTHPGEPCHPGSNCLAEHWELWLKDQKLSEWDIPAPVDKTRFDLG